MFHVSDLRLQLEQEVFFGATTEISSVPPDEVQLMDVSPQQIISIATALIPFLEHDDANRALMGANMQRQAVPLLRSEAPYIGTGVEARAAQDAADMLLAEDDGTVMEIDGDHMIVDYKKLGTQNIRLKKFERSNQDTCISQKPRVREGDRVKKGDVIARMYIPADPVKGQNTHIHFNLMDTGTRSFMTPSIFTDEIIREFHAKWEGRRALDGDVRVPPCMGYRISAKENPFGTGAKEEL